tara:strand:+ start:20344 stop:22233 length:1890 start_codon:yes stop_codon:yes gene_type:complete
MNQLTDESSAYLQQHASNPIHWHPWSKGILNKAASQNKWLLISIGYSTCHWCHIMEKEIFEDRHIADKMNEYFINIKVDREEHPDVDHAYMSAAIALTGGGGWPLNIVCLPNAKPIWASTYLPRENWINAINKLHQINIKSPDIAEDYAEKLILALNDAKEKKYPLKKNISWINFKEKTASLWDYNFGGKKGSPKFPMPNTLMQYLLTNLPDFEEHSLKSLKNIYHSGSYDILRGGLFRYSTDSRWMIPHFEKMLYDNALWIRFTAKAFHHSKDSLAYESFKKTKNWLLNEMELPSGLFAAAIDADFNGEEGLSYVWTNKQLDSALGDAADDFKAQLNDNSISFNNKGWILHNLAEKKNKTIWDNSIKKLKPLALKRDLPFVDKKSICSWNALTCISLLEGFLATGEDYFSSIKSSKAHWLEFQLDTKNPVHICYPDLTKKNDAYFDDLAFSALLALRISQATLDISWLTKCEILIDFIFDQFKGEEKKYFSYQRLNNLNHTFINFEDWEDDTIPSSLAAMAECLIVCGHLLHSEKKRNEGENMIRNACNKAFDNPDRYSTWINLFPFSNPDSKHLKISGNHRIHPLPYFRSPLWGPCDNKHFAAEVCTMNSCQIAHKSIDELSKYWDV